MSQERSAAENITKLTSEQVAEFLRINPEFFESNPDLVCEIQIPHIRGEGTTSLIEHQVRVIREKNETLKDQLKTFAVLATENEDLWFSFKDLAVLLLENQDQDTQALIRLIEKWLLKKYDLSGAKISLKNPAILLKKFKKDPAVKDLISEEKIHCDNELSTEVLTALFGKGAANVKSSALIPLKDSNNQCNGLLALGSENSERFSSAQSTSYLDCLSQLLSQAIPGKEV